MRNLQEVKDQVTAQSREHRGGSGRARDPVADTPGWWLRKIIFESAFHNSLRDAERELGVPELSRAFHGFGVPPNRAEGLLEKLALRHPDTWVLFGDNLKLSLTKHNGFRTNFTKPRVAPRPVKLTTGPRVEAGRLIASVANNDFGSVTSGKEEGPLRNVETWQKLAAGDSSVPARTVIDALYCIRERYKLHVTNKEQYRAIKDVVAKLWLLAQAETPKTPASLTRTEVPLLLNRDGPR